MHPEFEKLIDLAIADGQITEKERLVILKKAKELSIDTDEVEMILDGKLHQLEAIKPKQKEKVGNIKTCPACGAHLKNLDVVCNSCGHEVSGVDINPIMHQLISQLQYVKSTTEKTKVIRAFSIPNEKGAYIDFLNYLFSHVVTGNPNEEDLKCNDLLKQKAVDTLNKAKIYFKNDLDIVTYIKDYSSNLNEKFYTTQYLVSLGKIKQRKSYLWTTIGLVIFFGVFIIMKNLSPKIEDQQSVTSKIWPFWLISSVITIAFASYYNIEWKKHRKRFPFLEKFD
jgi:hypothetical protein